MVVVICDRIIGALDEEELGLFRERIKFLDKRIHPGLVKFNWAQSVSDIYIQDCRINAVSYTHLTLPTTSLV